MKKWSLKRSQIRDVLWILIIGIIVFTPVGFQFRVHLTRWLSLSPQTVSIDERTVLDDFNWQVKDRNGATFSLESVAGKVVVINYWATWCAPCVAEMPSLNTLYQDFGDKVAFVFVARDEKEKVLAFLSEQEYDLPVYFEYGKPPAPLQSASLPTTYILSRDGEIVVEEVGSANWNSSGIRQLLSELLQG